MTLVLLSAIHQAAPHRPPGYIAEVLNAGVAVSTSDGDFIEIPDDAYDALAEKYSGKPAEKGPGTVMHRLLDSMGIKSLPGCQCLKRKAVMDGWGWTECQKPERLDEIVGWMEEEASLRGLPFVRIAVRAALVAGLAAGSVIYDRKEQ